MLDFFNNRRVFTVSELTVQIKILIEENFFYVSVVGEISNFRVRGDHAYFSLKDENAVLKAVMFGLSGKKLGFKPEEGMRVICAGRLSVYDRRGEYQLIVDKIELVGMGKLYQEFEALKKKLAAEGLFDKSFKKELPIFPWRIGIITSPSGAAIRDMLKVIKEKGVGGEVFLYPARVQGTTAHLELIEGIRFFNSRFNVDVIIIGRGGGSFEDLMAFNDENLAREIRKSKIPIISAVGHEIDFTISDFVSDYRAPTPTAAAEVIVRLQKDFIELFVENIDRVIRVIQDKLDVFNDRYQYLITRLLEFVNTIQMRIQDIDNYQVRMERAMVNIIQSDKKRLEYLSRTLDNLSPLKVLGRGFALVKKKETEEIVISSKQLRRGELVNVKFSEGEVDCEVVEIYTDS